MTLQTAKPYVKYVKEYSCEDESKSCDKNLKNLGGIKPCILLLNPRDVKVDFKLEVDFGKKQGETSSSQTSIVNNSGRGSTVKQSIINNVDQGIITTNEQSGISGSGNKVQQSIVNSGNVQITG